MAGAQIDKVVDRRCKLFCGVGSLTFSSCSFPLASCDFCSTQGTSMVTVINRIMKGLFFAFMPIQTSWLDEIMKLRFQPEITGW
jgi:hypothetical protein